MVFGKKNGVLVIVDLYLKVIIMFNRIIFMLFGDVVIVIWMGENL